jgi:heme/copper-type cytochrome/quinol oxidase subunit 3
VALETACLLASSFAGGMASVAASVRSQLWTQIGLLVTGLLGFAFVVLEVREFTSLIAAGAGPTRSAFLTSYFSLVGLHGVHVSVGLLWLGTMMAQIWVKGFRPDIMRRLLCFTLFWHALDIIWVAILTMVYLMGAG